MRCAIILVGLLSLATASAFSIGTPTIRRTGTSLAGPSMGVTIRKYDELLNKAAPVVVPLLVGYGSKVFKPLYTIADKFRKRKEPTELRSTTSNACKPIVVFSSRTVKNAEVYQTAFAKYAEEAQSSGPGVRACFSFMDREKEDTVLQFAWYDSPADYVKQPQGLVNLYGGSESTDYTQVWGGWDDELKAKLSEEGECKRAFVKEVRGFLKQATAANAAGFATGEPPMIWISRRDILPGRMQAAGESFQCGTDRMFKAAPAALGICEYTAEDDADSTWSLRVFSDYDTGFKAHFPVPSPIVSSGWSSTSSPSGCPDRFRSGSPSPRRSTLTMPWPPTAGTPRTSRTSSSRIRSSARSPTLARGSLKFRAIPEKLRLPIERVGWRDSRTEWVAGGSVSANPGQFSVESSHVKLT